MNRQTLLLSALGAVLLLVLYYFFAWAPKSAEIAEINEQTEAAITQQATLESRIRALEEVRARAPEIEAALASAESVVPRDAALPSALRQLQLAADDSGVEMISVSVGRPSAAGIADVPDLANMSVSVQVNGSYFQTVDFLRRLEDPGITPRGFVWSAAAFAPSEYPSLSVSLSGNMYAVLPGAPAQAEQPADTPTEDGATEAPQDDTTQEAAE